MPSDSDDGGLGEAAADVLARPGFENCTFSTATSSSTTSTGRRRRWSTTGARYAGMPAAPVGELSWGLAALWETPSEANDGVPPVD